jgi:hypothetical protein
MRGRWSTWLAAAVAVVLCGCTSVAEIRRGDTRTLPDVDDNRLVDCKSGRPVEREQDATIEDYGRYWLGFVEFDDQGWSYSRLRQLGAIEDRLRGQLRDVARADEDVDVLVFIHGWHHNAHDNDCNVNEFRAMLRRAADRYDAAGVAHHPRVVGVYVAWRGEVVDAPLIRHLSILDRRNSAEHVAKGQVREVFATLRRIELEANAADSAAAAPGAKPRDRVHSMVMGHSFGGLIAFNALSQSLVSELEARRPLASRRCAGLEDHGTRTWPDQLVLINPAFEATRFEPLHHLMLPVPGCPYPDDQPPKVIVATADNDSATGPVFTAFRKLLTMLERYGHSDADDLAAREQAANLHAVGFVPNYRTHRLCLNQDNRAVAQFRRPDDALDPADPHAPVWVAGAPPEIINNHDGFLYARKDSSGEPQPHLLDWLLEVHVPALASRSLRPDSRAFDTKQDCPGWK